MRVAGQQPRAAGQGGFGQNQTIVDFLLRQQSQAADASADAPCVVMLRIYELDGLNVPSAREPEGAEGAISLLKIIGTQNFIGQFLSDGWRHQE